MTIATPPLGRRKKLIGALVESTAGTENEPTAALGMNIFDAKMAPDGMYPESRLPQGNYLGTSDRIIGLQKGKLTFRWEAAHADALLTLIQGCGFSAAGVPLSSIASMASLSMALWEDGRKKRMRGCSGTLSIEGSSGGKFMGTEDFDGVWVQTEDEAMPALSPLTATVFRVAGLTLTLGGAALPGINQVTISIGAQVEPRQDVTNAAGVLHYAVLDINPTVQLDPESRLVAGHDGYGLLLAGTTGVFQAVLTDGASKTLTIDGIRAQRTEISDGEREGKVTDPITLELHNSAGNDSLIFTKSA